MKNQGLIRAFTIALAVVCIYHLSFTIRALMVESKADAIAQGNQEVKRKYLDSISGQTVYNLGLKKFNYLQVKERQLNLGLDLQGGMNVTLEVSMPELIDVLANRNEDPRFKKALALATEKTNNSQDDFITLFIQAAKTTAPGVRLSDWFAHKENKDQLSFNSSDSDVESFLRSEADDAVERTFRILRSRIDRFGVSQPVIQKLGNTGRIMVELPGISNPESARKLLQASAKLEFWKTYLPYQSIPFIEQMDKALKRKLDLAKTEDTTSTGGLASTPDNTGLTGLAPETDTTKSAELSAEVLGDSGKKTLGALGEGEKLNDTAANTPEQFKANYPLISKLNSERSFLNIRDNKYGESSEIAFVSVFDTADINQYLNDPDLLEVIPGDVRFAWHYKPDDNNFVALYALKAGRDNRPSLEGDVIEDARSQIGQKGFEVSMRMNNEGATIWKRITGEAAKQSPSGCIAIVLDGVVYSSPRVENEIAGGQSQISGNFTQDDTKFLANILKSGKLPVTARIVEEAVVGPSLGKEAISKGLLSILIGFIAVILIMAVIYSSAGWVANMAVLLNLFFIIGVLASLQAALTLPGIAGIILTLGMAVDANVLINERIKEELGLGKNLRTSITNGYRNALSAILDSNITTLLTGIVLLKFGVGPIYGFSVTLIIGILCSLFTAILMTRIILERFLVKEKNIKFSSPATARLFKGTNINFIGNRKIYYTISGILIAAGLVSIFTKGLSYGVDFEGGWSYVVRFEQATSSGVIREQLTSVFEGAPEVKAFGTDNTYKITTKFNIDDQSAEAGEKVEAAMTQALKQGNLTFEIESNSKVGPTVADDIKQSAITSIFVALVLMFSYILIRFRKWQFATGTVIKLIHDVLIVLGLFSLLDGIVPFSLEIDSSFIAAILTVIGYSINDSVVVMDRVREFLREHKGAKGLKNIFNNALNDTLSRTMITSLTTIAVLIFLFIFGGDVIRGFTFAMLAGIIVGSYSSICIGAPLAGDLVKEKDL